MDAQRTPMNEQARSRAAQAQQALRAGNPRQARDLLLEAVGFDGGRPELWLNLAVAQLMLKDLPAQLAALEKVLALQPRHLTALLLKGAAQQEMGEHHKAGQTFNAALAVAPPFEQVPPDLKGLVRQAYDAVQKFKVDFEDRLRSDLSRSFGAIQGKRFGRFNQALDIFVGKKSFYPQKPHTLYVPDLPGIQFYDTDDMPWVPHVATETEAIRAEFLDVLSRDQNLVPYVDYPPGIPLDQWAELNQSPRWSAFYLYRDGGLVAENAARCPRTLAAMEHAPRAHLPKRSSAAMFSILRPRTRIPPHTGVTNARLVVHVPLVVPEKCGFRVGNDVCEWKMGDLFVFNDTIEHEAWNDSDKNRAVLIFDIWNPGLTEEEQALIAALFDSSDDFLGTTPSNPI